MLSMQMPAELGEVAVAATLSPIAALVLKGDAAVPMLNGLVKETNWPVTTPPLYSNNDPLLAATAASPGAVMFWMVRKSAWLVTDTPLVMPCMPPAETFTAVLLGTPLPASR